MPDESVSSSLLHVLLLPSISNICSSSRRDGINLRLLLLLLKFLREVQAVRVTTEAGCDITKGGFHFLVSLSGTGCPKDFDSFTLTGNGGNAIAIHFKSSTSQEFVLEIHQHVLLITGSTRWFKLSNLEVLVDIVTLLRDCLDDGLRKEILILVMNVLCCAGKKRCCETI